MQELFSGFFGAATLLFPPPSDEIQQSHSQRPDLSLGACFSMFPDRTPDLARPLSYPEMA
jgi:hypothetical protein